MKKTACIIFGILVSMDLCAQEPGFAPLNPEFVAYLEQMNKQERTKSTIESKFGYVPSPLQLNFANYKVEGTVRAENNQSVSLPARFDLRDSGFVTSVKVQGGPWCWAFAIMGAIESNWLVNHWGSFDLSEQNMVACNGINSSYWSGGTANMCSAYLTRLSGPVLETDDPLYSDTTCKNIQFPVPRYVLTSRFLPPDHELIKRTIMTHGGVETIMKWSNQSENLSPVDATFYYAGDVIGNEHNVLLVGWDDNKVVTGGTKSPKGTKGAWIIKNSWGETAGEDGFYYISYYDKGALRQNCYFDECADTAEIDAINMYDVHGASRAFGFGKEVAYGLTKYYTPVKEIIKKVGTYIISACSSIDIEIYDDFTDGKLSALLYSKKDLFVEFPGQRVFNVVAKVEGDYYIKIKYNTPVCYHPIPVESYIQNVSFLPPDIMQPGTNWVSSDGETWETIGSGINDREMDLTIRSYTITADKTYGFFELPERQLCICDSLSVFAELSDPSIACNWQFLPDGMPMNYTGPGPVKVKFATPGVKIINLIMDDKNGYDTISRSLKAVTSLDVEINASFENLLEHYCEGYVESAIVNEPMLLSVREEADSFKWNPPYDTVNKSEILVTPDHACQNLYYVTVYKGTCIGYDTITIEAHVRPGNDDIRNAIELHEGLSGSFTNFYATVEENEPCPPFNEYGGEGYWYPDGGLQNSLWFWFTAGRRDSTRIFVDGFNQIAIYEADSAADLLKGTYKLLSTSDNMWVESGLYHCRITLNELTIGKKYWLQYDGRCPTKGVFKIGIHYPKYFRTSEDTLTLGCDANSAAQLIIQADTNWYVGKASDATWIGYTPLSGIGGDTITVFSKKANETGAPRSSSINLNSPFIETKTIVVTQQYMTGIKEPGMSPGIVLYPNPVFNELFIKGLDIGKLSNCTFILTDISGRIVKKAQAQNSGKINVSDLSKGLYFFEILQDGHPVTVLKFIKE